MARQSFFVDGKYLGARNIPNFIKIPGFDIRPSHSYVYFCMRCGDIWARFLLDGPSLHQFRCIPCAKHGDGKLGAYPAWDWDPTHFDDDWPDDAVRYEFNILLNHALKELSHAPQ